MSWSHQADNQDGGSSQVTINNLPDECPQCHNKGTFPPIKLFYNAKAPDTKRVEIVFRCPNSRCHEVFIGYYSLHQTGHYNLSVTAPKEHSSREFSETVQNISADFSRIYNQAQKAEDLGLDQICGSGYRKSLEFLIKDYLIAKADNEEEKEVIKKEALGACIANRIQDASVKEVAKRAVWLGNDETHYVRKWEAKDLQDLKKLIDLTVHWMEAEALTTQLLADMP